MLNLLRFTEGGEGAYRSYLVGARPIIERIGGTVLHGGPLGTLLLDDDGDGHPWDAIVLVRWQRRAMLADLVRDAEYRHWNEHRLGALEATVLQASGAWPELT